MNKKEFLKRLDERLRFLADEERKDILFDYEDHFNAAMENGETEEDIIKALGSPEIIARQFRMSRVIHKAETEKTSSNLVRAVLATIGLGFFNILFIVAPFFLIVGLLLGFYGMAFGFIVGGVVMTGAGLIGLLGGDLTPFIHLGGSVVFDSGYLGLMLAGFGVCMGSVGGLFGIGSFALTKAFYNVTVHYLKFNVKVIRGDSQVID